MKQVVRRVIDRRGRVQVIDLPEPHLGPDQVLVQTHYSLISSGTETTTLSKTPVELAKQTLADPWMRNVVKQTVFSTGPAQTVRRVWHEMVMPREIGYSAPGPCSPSATTSRDSRYGLDRPEEADERAQPGDGPEPVAHEAAEGAQAVDLGLLGG